MPSKILTLSGTGVTLLPKHRYHILLLTVDGSRLQRQNIYRSRSGINRLNDELNNYRVMMQFNSTYRLFMYHSDSNKISDRHIKEEGTEIIFEYPVAKGTG